MAYPVVVAGRTSREPLELSSPLRNKMHSVFLEVFADDVEPARSSGLKTARTM